MPDAISETEISRSLPRFQINPPPAVTACSASVVLTTGSQSGKWAFNSHSPVVESLRSRAPRSAVGTAATSRSTANCSSLSSEASAPT